MYVSQEFQDLKASHRNDAINFLRNSFAVKSTVSAPGAIAQRTSNHPLVQVPSQTMGEEEK